MAAFHFTPTAQPLANCMEMDDWGSYLAHNAVAIRITPAVTAPMPVVCYSSLAAVLIGLATDVAFESKEHPAGAGWVRRAFALKGWVF